MSVPGYSKGRDGEGNFGDINPGGNRQQASGYDGRPFPRRPSPSLDPDYDEDKGGSATNKNVNTVKGGNVTIGDVGSNNVTRINAKNKAQEFKKKKEAVESEEAKADTDADVSNETEKEQEEETRQMSTDKSVDKKRERYRTPGKPFIPQYLNQGDRPSGIPERSVTVRNPDGSKGGFSTYTDRRDGRTREDRAKESGFMYGGSGGYNFNRGGGRTPMRRGAGIRRTGRG